MTRVKLEIERDVLDGTIYTPVGAVTWLTGRVRVELWTARRPPVLLPTGEDPLVAMGEHGYSHPDAFARVTLGGFEVSRVAVTRHELWDAANNDPHVYALLYDSGGDPSSDERFLIACKPVLVRKLHEHWRFRCQVAESTVHLVMTAIMCERSQSEQLVGRWDAPHLASRLQAQIDTGTLTFVIVQLVQCGILVRQRIRPAGNEPAIEWLEPDLDHEAVSRMEIAVEAARQEQQGAF